MIELTAAILSAVDRWSGEFDFEQVSSIKYSTASNAPISQPNWRRSPAPLTTIAAMLRPVRARRLAEDDVKPQLLEVSNANCRL
jgi:hypothetical protein